VRAICEAACAAPSGGNAQPWRLAYDARASTLEISLDPARTGTLLDFERSASWMALGAATENALLAAMGQGRVARLERFPDPEQPLLAARLPLATAGSNEFTELRLHELEGLARVIHARETNRCLGNGEPLSPEHHGALAHAAESVSGARLQLVTHPSRLREIGEILGKGDRVRFLNQRLFEEMMGELRWSSDEARSSGDGIDVDSLELGPAERAGLQLGRCWRVMRVLAQVGGGQGLEKNARRAVASSSAVGLLTMRGTERENYFEGGRALQRLWLRATELGLAFQPLASLPYLFARLERGGANDFSIAQRSALQELRASYSSIFEVSGDVAEILLFRVSRAPRASVRALRRPLDQVLEVRSHV
jgi:hypothetical protein